MSNHPHTELKKVFADLTDGAPHSSSYIKLEVNKIKKLIKAQRVALLEEILADVPEKRLKRNGEPTKDIATAEWGYNQALDQVTKLIQRKLK